MGVVFAAHDQRLKRQVAIKVLPPEFAFREESPHSASSVKRRPPPD